MSTSYQRWNNKHISINLLTEHIGEQKQKLEGKNWQWPWNIKLAKWLSRKPKASRVCLCYTQNSSTCEPHVGSSNNATSFCISDLAHLLHLQCGQSHFLYARLSRPRHQPSRRSHRLHLAAGRSGFLGHQSQQQLPLFPQCPQHLQ